MDGDGSLEIVVGRQITGGMKMLSVYSTKGYQMSVLINTDYTEYTVCSLTDNPGTDLLVLRTSSADQAREATLYTCHNDGDVTTSTARVSAGAANISRLRATVLNDDKNAVLVEGTLNGDMMFTDVFTCIGNRLKNITADSSGVSRDTVRQYSFYCRDIDEDGRVEIPKLVPMMSINEQSSYWFTQWYSYSSNGKASLDMTTYNNTTDGWMFEVPEGWTDHLAVRRAEYISGERIVIFSYVDKGKSTDIFAIYTLSGENKEERAKLSGRFNVGVESERIFSARLYDHDLVKELKVTETFVKENFSIIYSEWNTGET